MSEIKECKIRIDLYAGDSIVIFTNDEEMLDSSVMPEFQNTYAKVGELKLIEQSNSTDFLVFTFNGFSYVVSKFLLIIKEND